MGRMIDWKGVQLRPMPVEGLEKLGRGRSGPCQRVCLGVDLSVAQNDLCLTLGGKFKERLPGKSVTATAVVLDSVYV